MNTLHVKKGDTVTILSGVDKGKTGKVTRVYPRQGLVVVEGVGMRVKHQRPRREGQAGQIVQKQQPIHASKDAKKQTKKRLPKPPKKLWVDQCHANSPGGKGGHLGGGGEDA